MPNIFHLAGYYPGAQSCFPDLQHVQSGHDLEHIPLLGYHFVPRLIRPGGLQLYVFAVAINLPSLSRDLERRQVAFIQSFMGIEIKPVV